MCDDHKNNNNSLFIMGLILGAIIASAVVLISAEDKQKIVKKIKIKFNNLFKDKIESEIKREEKIAKKVVKKAKKIIAKNIVTPVKKIAVSIPNNVETLNLTPKKETKPKKVFKKSK